MYTQALEYITSLKSAGIHPGLGTVQALCRALGNPQDALQTVHVAGTNGKGSTCAYCAGILHAAGKKVGLFSSPYVVELREMIQIDGQMLSKEQFAEGVFAVKRVCDANHIHPTEFEFLTALAFYIFEQQRVDVAVIEVGMGGAADATNIIAQPAVCVLTHIALDHATFLGNTIEEVARQKCGIIKPGCRVISFPNTAVKKIITGAAQRQGAAVEFFAPEDIQNITVSLQGTAFIYQNKPYTAIMMGTHQAQNAVAAIMAAGAFCGDLPHSIIQKGLQVALPARLEVLSTNPLVLLDGAHNPDGAAALAATLQALGLKDLVGVTAMMADKDMQGVLRQVAPFCKKIIATKVPNNPRSATAETLAELAGAYCPATALADCFAALAQAKKETSGGVLVFGSLYLAEALKKSQLF